MMTTRAMDVADMDKDEESRQNIPDDDNHMWRLWPERGCCPSPSHQERHGPRRQVALLGQAFLCILTSSTSYPLSIIGALLSLVLNGGSF
jgi:hypothetical protein